MYKNYKEILKNYKPIYVPIDAETYNTISCIAEASYTTKQKIAYTLIQTAAKYNFNRDFQYICCKTQNHTFASRGTPTLTHKIKLYISYKNLPTLEKFQLALCTATLSAAIRSLITIALEYDYNEKLIFSNPIPLDINKYIPDGGANPDFVLLDIL